jgi:hypothetical protein
VCLIALIRALITTLVLASYSPVGDSWHAGHLSISMFIARRTRVAASQQFDVASWARCAPRPTLATPSSATP